MNYRRDNDFFDKLHNDDRPRNLREIFEDDGKPLEHESKNLRYQPDLTHKQKEKQQQREKEKQLHKERQKQYERGSRKVQTHSTTLGSKEDAAQSALSWTTIIAKVAVGFNGGQNLGRVGVALSRNEAGGAKLVVYKNPCKLLTTLLLTKTSTSPSPRGCEAKVIWRQSYIQFYDDSLSYWSLRFENEIDEQEFLKVLEKNGLPVESVNDTIIDPRTDSSTHNTTLTKLQNMTASMATESDANEAATSQESDSDSTQSMDVLTLPDSARKTLMTVANTNTNTSATLELTKALPEVSANSLESYLEDNRAVKKQVSNIMRTVSEADSSIKTKKTNAEEIARSHARDRNIEIILHAMGHLSTNGAQKENDSVEVVPECSDNEDQMLELEQKLLDSKKKNRALVKDLKYKEQALAELRASTSALCEELMAQDNEIKLKNKTIIALASKENNNRLEKLELPVPTTDCANCKQYIIQIADQEQRMTAMYNILISYTSEGASPAPAVTEGASQL